MSKPQSFFHVILQASLKAHWGKDYDPALMAAISHLRDAEKYFTTANWEEIERRIELGELTRDHWSKDFAVKDLESARSDFWIAKDKLSDDLGSDSAAFKAIADHYERFAEWEENQKPEKAEFIFACWAAEILSRRVLPKENNSRRVPTYHEVEELIEGLRFLATKSDIHSELARPVTEAVKLLARSHSHAEKAHWTIAYSKQMESAADWIRAAGLFTAVTIRVDKLLAGSGVKLKHSKEVKGKF